MFNDNLRVENPVAMVKKCSIVSILNCVLLLTEYGVQITGKCICKLKN